MNDFERTSATVPIDVAGKIVRMNLDGPSEAAGNELTAGDQPPNGPGREPKNLGDLVNQVEPG